MRGIQFVYVSPSGATQENVDLVRELENWFEDHRQLCRLMTTTGHQDFRELASSLDRLNASVDSGQRMLSRLKSSVQACEAMAVGVHTTTTSRIPLSGMNRFDEARSVMQVSNSSASGLAMSSSVSGPQAGTGLSSNFMSLSNSSSADTPRMQPSRTYLKKTASKS